MTIEIIQAFVLIFIAEMGDKTQILAMTFATRYPVRKVLIGIGLGSLLNHGLAVILGSYLSRLIPINIIQMVAGFAFVGFALWTLKTEDDNGEDEEKFQLSPVLTVSLAFFLGELGDKTQLTAVTLAVNTSYPLMILIGTVTAMMATGGLGILIGKKMGDKIPELGIKLVASSIFLFFGMQKLSQTVPSQFMTANYVMPFVAVIAIIVGLMIRTLLIQRKEGIQSAYVKQSKLLHDYTTNVMEELNDICLGSEVCGECKSVGCAIGYSKDVILKHSDINDIEPNPLNDTDFDKPFSKTLVIESLVNTLHLIEQVSDKQQLNSTHEVRRQLERILFCRTVEEYVTVEDYLEQVSVWDRVVAKQIQYQLNMKKPTHERILNLGNKVGNVYLLMIPEGYALIDTGYREYYARFRSKLAEYKIDLDEIKYVFVTHAHDDHVGFLNQILEATDAQIIMHKDSVDRLKTGQNSFDGGCSSRLAWSFCQLMKLFGKGEHRFEAVDRSERYLTIDNGNKEELETYLSGQIIDLPGHTMDSIGLLVDNKVLFCGDASMNGLPSQNNIIIWIENVLQYKNSWNKMIDLEFDKVYPSHGKPFNREQLIKNSYKLDEIKLYKLS